LDTVFEALSAAIAKWRPDAVAVERIFYKMNARTLVPVAQASGVALLAAARAGAKVYEYAPLEVKLAVVGTGAATKDQMRFMVARLLSGSFRTDTPDAADALAVAICHLHSRKVRALGGAPRRSPRSAARAHRCRPLLPSWTSGGWGTSCTPRPRCSPGSAAGSTSA